MSGVFEDTLINLLTYLTMAAAWLSARLHRHPKFALIFTLISFGSFCIYHAFAAAGNKPFFSLTGLFCALVAPALISLYGNKTQPSTRRRPDILSTDNDWFSERELA